MANHMNRDWGWPTVVATFQPIRIEARTYSTIWSPDKQTGLPVRQHPRRVAMRGCQSHRTSSRGYSSYRGQRRWPGAHENVDGTVIVGMPARSGKVENRHVLALPQLQGKRSEQSDRLAQASPR